MEVRLSVAQDLPLPQGLTFLAVLAPEASLAGAAAILWVTGLCV